MSEHQISHTSTLHNEHRFITNAIVWKKTQIWLQIITFLILCCTAYWYWQETTFAINNTTKLTAAFLGAYFVTIVSVVSNQITMIALLRRDQAVNELRFDIYQAVCEMLRLALGKYLDGYTHLHTNLDVGEALLYKAEFISKRRANFQTGLAEKLPGLKLSAAIDAFVKASLEASGQSSDVAAVERILSGFEDSNVVELSQRTSIE